MWVVVARGVGWDWGWGDDLDGVEGHFAGWVGVGVAAGSLCRGVGGVGWCWDIFVEEEDDFEAYSRACCRVGPGNGLCEACLVINAV